MRIAIVCPAPPRSLSGNRATARRWRSVLTGLGHDAVVIEELGRHRADLVVALHARRSAPSVFRSRELAPTRPVIVALTGTDLYGDIRTDPIARRALAEADLLVVLHPGAERALPRSEREKARFVPQSAMPVEPRPRPSPRAFEVAVVGHLREVKDPFRAALAARRLPRESRVQVVHAGAAMTGAMARAARREMRENPRYRWIGEVSPAAARRLIARAPLLVLTSKLEGGANVLSEALASGTAVVSSRIACAEGLLGADHPGLFRFGDDRALARLLERAERDPVFLAELTARSIARRRIITPAAERASWRAILRELW